MNNKIDLLTIFVLCYMVGVGSLVAILLGEGLVGRFPNTKFSKWWRKQIVSNHDLEK